MVVTEKQPRAEDKRKQEDGANSHVRNAPGVVGQRAMRGHVAHRTHQHPEPHRLCVGVMADEQRDLKIQNSVGF